MIGINVHWNSVNVTSETEEKRALNFARKKVPVTTSSSGEVWCKYKIDRWEDLCGDLTIERALGQLLYNPAQQALLIPKF